MNENSKWLEETKSRAIALSEAYRLQLRKLWWANLMFVVVPATFTTLSAILAAIPLEKSTTILSLPAASFFAGAAAILMAIHKALKCDEYQAECLRLSQAYQSVAITAESALSGQEEERASLQKLLTKELEELSKNAKAQVSFNFMNQTT